MLTETYIEALLVGEELADLVWEVWDTGEADDQAACMAWMVIAGEIVVGIILLWCGCPALGHRRTVDALEGIRIPFTTPLPYIM